MKEAARIQPAYDSDSDDDEVSVGYAMASIVLSTTSLTSLGFNLIQPTKASALTGVVAGGAQLIAGMLYVTGDGGDFHAGGGSRPDGVGVANMLIGGGALAAGIIRAAKPPPAKTPVLRSLPRSFPWAIVPGWDSRSTPGSDRWSRRLQRPYHSTDQARTRE